MDFFFFESFLKLFLYITKMFFCFAIYKNLEVLQSYNSQYKKRNCAKLERKLHLDLNISNFKLRSHHHHLEEYMFPGTLIHPHTSPLTLGSSQIQEVEQ